MKNDFYVFTDSSGKFNIPLEQITRFDAIREYTLAHTADGKQYLHYRYLGRLNRELQYTRLFMRVHKSTLVNKTYIKGWMRKGRRVYCQMRDGSILCVARKRKNCFMNTVKRRALYFIEEMYR